MLIQIIKIIYSNFIKKLLSGSLDLFKSALHISQLQKYLHLEWQLWFSQYINYVLDKTFKTGGIQICCVILVLKYFILINFPLIAVSPFR